MARVLPKLRGMPPFVLTPTFLFDMGFPTPMPAAVGWATNTIPCQPANRMMARSPKWEGKFRCPRGWAYRTASPPKACAAECSS